LMLKLADIFLSFSFVTGTRTQHTCMPSASDKLRLEKVPNFHAIACSGFNIFSGFALLTAF
jgi:hypothetical protein